MKTLPTDLIDNMLGGYQKPEDLIGEFPIKNMRDRLGSFEPQIIAKNTTRWTGFDDKIISLHARGMKVREIQSYLTGMYGANDIGSGLANVTGDALNLGVIKCCTQTLWFESISFQAVVMQPISSD